VNVHVKIAAGLIVLGLIAAAGYKYVWPRFEERRQIDTSDARGAKGRIVIGTDNWVGYFPLCSDEMKKRMRGAGYVLHCEEDKADYPARFAALRAGQLQFAVATIDAYLLNGPGAGFPGAIVAIIDESKGGDAIVGWQDRVASIEALKAHPTPSIAFTPGSPSEHLLRSAAVHFDVTGLREGSAWRVETDGSPAALNKFLSRKVDAAVLWEPDVTRALNTKGAVKLLSTADTQRLIVDVLIAGRNVLQQDPEMVKALLQTYFEVARYYRDRPDALARDVAASTRLPAPQVTAMLSGVAWTSLTDNFQVWLGSTPDASATVDVIQSTLRVLEESAAIKHNPLPDRDPYRILNRQFIGAAFTSAATGAAAGPQPNPSSLEKRFDPLDDEAWSRLREVGTLKAFNVSFQSGTSDLGHDGKLELDRMMEILRHYPTFRILVRGHTGLNGDPEENKRLSGDRAEAVARYMNVTYNVDLNRMRVVGIGAAQPLARIPGESERAYQYRLPRVELSLLAEVL
jgi:outer membrane protein OmpA-like peptidoglycan-associated protein/ABC-type nitrate/sulfonate/bicarbonate transport system substrate-binding protein